MPKTGDYARTTGEYAADCMHWTIFMRGGLEFPPCPQCHRVVEYKRIVKAAVEPQMPPMPHPHGVRRLVGERWSQHHGAAGRIRRWSR